MNAKQKERADSLEKRRRSARDWHLYVSALNEWLMTNLRRGELEEFELAISRNGSGWALLGVARETSRSDDPMIFWTLPELELGGDLAEDEASHRFKLAAESLKNYLRTKKRNAES